MTLPDTLHGVPTCWCAADWQCACVLSSAVFTWPSPESLVASDVAAAAAWLLRVARVYVSMISDIEGSSVSFVETLPGGGAGAQLTVDPISQSWMSTQLGATWTASVDKTVVATMKVRSGGISGLRCSRSVVVG